MHASRRTLNKPMEASIDHPVRALYDELVTSYQRRLPTRRNDSPPSIQQRRWGKKGSS
jgi:hypothetical protein